MLRYAVRGVRNRPGAHVAAGVVLAAGTALLTAFATLFETGGVAPPSDVDTLRLLPLILGGWTVVIVAFGVVSTVGLSLAQRDREIALLRSIAATPGQVRRALVFETMLVAVPMVAAGILPGGLVGAVILDRLVAFGAVGTPVGLRMGWFSVVAGAATALLAALVAALVASRRAARIPPVRAMAGAAGAPAGPPLSRPRLVAGFGTLGLGVALGITTLFMADGPLLSSTAGPAGVAASVGLALVSPALIAAVGRLAGVAPAAVGRLAGRDLRARALRTAGVVTPLVLLVGIATGTLYMQGTEDSVTPAGAGASTIAPINYLVVAMIIAFSAIAVVNTVITAVRGRRGEFGLLRLAGATRRQVLAVVGTETGLAAAIALLLGTLASLVTTVPYSLVRTGSPVAAGSAWIYPAVVVGTVLVALAPALITVRRGLVGGTPLHTGQ